MKKLSFAVIASCMTLLAVPLAAVDLKNEDSQGYDVVIEEGASSTNTSIGSSTTQMSVCSSCTIVVKGVGSVQASGGVTVTIRGGQLSVQ